jgi:PKD repeat protein
VTLDGTRSWTRTGTLQYAWRLSDGSTATGSRVTRRYQEPGTYSEQLIVTDDNGKSDSDFVEVFVLPRDTKKGPPFAWINYYPIRGIRPGTEVAFLTRFSNLKNVTIDYGDGQILPWALNTTHKYEKSGTYLITVRGEDTGSGLGIFHVRVVVE